MRMHKYAIPSLLALATLAMGCTENGTAAKATPASAPPQAIAEALEAPRAVSQEEATRSLPGFPMGEVPAHLRGKLISVAEDEFVYDGSPFTLAGCIRDDRPCKEPAVRGLGLLLRFMKAGAKESEALATYNRYYQSFHQRQRIDLSTAACMGPSDAPVTLVEFSDFECPYCDLARPILKGVVEQRSDTRLCFMHFPLPGHDHAMSAAQATAFAKRHGKFWELHDLIFENQRRLSDQTIRSLVDRVGLDSKAFLAAIRSGELAAEVDGQKAEGQRLGIQGTPSIFVNGRKLEVPMSPEMLQFTVDDELRWTSNGGSWNKKAP
jgi:hypothetical protein